MKKVCILLFAIFSINCVSAQSIMAGQHLENGYYYDIIPDTLLDSPDNFNPSKYSIDINGDGIIDFYIYAFDCCYGELGGGNKSSWIEALNGNQIAFAYFDSCFGNPNMNPPHYYFKTKMAYAFNFNDTINTHTTWIDTTAKLSYYNWLGGLYYCVDNTFSSSDSLYIGVKVFLLSDTFYGWIKVKGVSTTTVTIEEFASVKVSNTDSNSFINNNSFIIYPNPAKNSIIIETGQPFLKEATLSICNIKGQELIKQFINGSKTPIDISNFSGGVYFVKLITDKTVEVRKIIKEF